MAGNLLGAINGVSKGFKLLWLAMLENPLTAIIAVVGLLLPLLFSLGRALLGAGKSAKEMESEMKHVEKGIEDTAKAAGEMEKVKFQTAVDAAKELADAYERALKSATALQAAQDRLTNAQMAQELAGVDAEKEAAMAKVRGDKDAERRTELEFESKKSVIRDRYSKAEADAAVARASSAKVEVESAVESKRTTWEMLNAAASATSARRDKLRESLAFAGVMTEDGQINPYAVEKLQKEREKKMAAGKEYARESDLLRQAAVFGAVGQAANDAQQKSREALRAYNIAVEGLPAERQRAQMDLEAAQHKQRQVSSQTTTTQAGFQNRRAALDATIAGEKREEANREAAELARVRRIIATQKQQERDAEAESIRSLVGAQARRNIAGMARQPAGAVAAYRELEREALERLVGSVKEGTTADLLKQLNAAIMRKNQEEASVLREVISLLNQVRAQRANDSRR
jgi:hypothetical protein